MRLRLRDARRIAVPGRSLPPGLGYWHGHSPRWWVRLSRRTGQLHLMWSWEAGEDEERVLEPSELDRLISQHGADADLLAVLGADSPPTAGPRPVSDREHHAESVDADALGVDEDAATHGGDGNSGDCDHRAASERGDVMEPPEEVVPAPSTPWPDPDGMPADGDGDEGPARDGGLSDRAGAETDAEPDEGEVADGGRNESDRDPGDLPVADDLGADASSVDWATTETSGAEEADSNQREAGHDVSRTPSLQAIWGGIHADISSALRSPRRPDYARDAREVRRALERLLPPAVGQHGDPSPRVAPARLVRELKSRRCRLSAARREEMAPPMVLLLCDLSGSCAAAAEETVAACVEIARGREDVLLVLNSNGHPGVALCGGTPVATPKGWDHAASLRWYTEQIGRSQITGVVAFGDSDAAWLYLHLAALAPVWWLDSYLCRHSEAQRARVPVDGAPRSITYYRGVKSARSAAFALRDAVRGRGKRTNGVDIHAPVDTRCETQHER